MYEFIAKLLAADELALSLLDSSARAVFPGSHASSSGKGGKRKIRAPKYAKVDMYQYTMSAPLWELMAPWLRGETVTWWIREFEEPLVPVVVLHRGQLARATTS